MTIYLALSGQHPGVNTEHTPSFVGGGDQTLPKQPLYYLSDSILDSVQHSVGNLTTYWSHNTIADGSCKSIGKDPVSAKYSSRSGDPNVLHEIPDLWQFCKTIGKGNHNNISYNVLCCGIPPNFSSQLTRLNRYRRYNPHSPMNFTFVVPIDPTATWWPLLPGRQVPTTIPIVLTYNDQTTVPAALFTTVDLQMTDPTPKNLQSWSGCSPEPTNNLSPPSPPHLNTVLLPSALKKSTSPRSRLKAISRSPPTVMPCEVKVEDCVPKPVEKHRKDHITKGNLLGSIPTSLSSSTPGDPTVW